MRSNLLYKVIIRYVTWFTMLFGVFSEWENTQNIVTISHLWGANRLSFTRYHTLIIPCIGQKGANPTTCPPLHIWAKPISLDYKSGPEYIYVKEL